MRATTPRGSSGELSQCRDQLYALLGRLGTRAPTPAEGAELAWLRSNTALAEIRAGGSDSAEAILRAGLTGGAPVISGAARACLLNNLALCALHEGRPAEAPAFLRYAADLLPVSMTSLLPSELSNRLGSVLGGSASRKGVVRAKTRAMARA